MDRYLDRWWDIPQFNIAIKKKTVKYSLISPHSLASSSATVQRAPALLFPPPPSSPRPPKMQNLLLSATSRAIRGKPAPQVFWISKSISHTRPHPRSMRDRSGIFLLHWANCLERVGLTTLPVGGMLWWEVCCLSISLFGKGEKWWIWYG